MIDVEIKRTHNLKELIFWGSFKPLNRYLWSIDFPKEIKPFMQSNLKTYKVEKKFCY